MKKLLYRGLASMFMMSMLAACIVTPRGEIGLLLPPPLPIIVDLGPDRYYQYEGYQYYYEGNRWQYSRDRGGPRSDLPRSHWPNEIRRRGDWR